VADQSAIIPSLGGEYVQGSFERIQGSYTAYSYECVLGSYECIQGVFASLKGSFENIWGSFECVQSSFACLLGPFERSSLWCVYRAHLSVSGTLLSVSRALLRTGMQTHVQIQK